jgi:hypothetical protein
MGMQNSHTPGMFPAFFLGKNQGREQGEAVKQNVGGIDQQIRIVLGMVLLLVAILAPLNTTWKLVLIIIGAIALITGITGL